MPAAITRLVLDYAERRGCLREPLLREIVIDPEQIEDPEGRVSNAAMRRLWECVADRLREPALALKVAMEMPLGALGVFGHLLTACESVDEAVRQWERYQAFVGDDVAVVLHRSERCFEVCLTDEIPKSDPAWTFGVEFTLAAIVRGLGELAHVKVTPVAAEFPFQEPKHHSEYADTFGSDLRFSMPRGRLLFFPALLRQKSLTAHRAVYRTLVEQMDTSAGKQAQADTLAQVEAVLESLLPLANADLNVVSRKLGMSQRTLQRRLKEEDNLTFSDVLASFRMRRAEILLRQAHLSIEEIGFRLGYADMAAFHRAFKRHHRDITPGAFRKNTRQCS